MGEGLGRNVVSKTMITSYLQSYDLAICKLLFPLLALLL